ncbi:outer membrane protein assembly factor BamE [Sphingomonas sp. ac-8]|uniref:outer membrane protein assembly factor BamE n=1 Tax=Sphingomonas sp. ac-8 TaxID=3242977 RepID=UPI003A811A9A
MKLFAHHGVAVAAVALAALSLGGCARVRTHQGYVIDADLVNAVQPGVDTRDSVASTLGHPTFTGQFGAGNTEWYYVSRDSRNLAFNRPNPVEQTTLRVRFDQNGTVQSIDRTGIEQVASISPSGKKTPTLGRERSFFQDLFGNIGTVGAAGMGGGGNPNQ